MKIQGARDVQNQIKQVAQSVNQVPASTNRAGQSLDNMQQGFKQTGQAAQRSGQQLNSFSAPLRGVTAPAASAQRAMQQMGAVTVSSTHQAGNALNQFGGAASQVSTSTVSAGQSIKNLGGALQGSAMSFGVASAGAVGLWAAYDNVGDAATRVELAEGKVLAATNKLSKAREDLAKKQQDGATSALDLEQAQRAVAVAEVNVERATFGLTNAQEDLNTTWVSAATSIVPSLAATVGGLTTGFSSLRGAGVTLSGSMHGLGGIFTGMIDRFKTASAGGAQFTNSMRTVASSATPLGGVMGGAAVATNTMGNSLKATGAASGPFTSGMRAVQGGIRGVYAALGPVGWIMIGIGALFTAIASNAFGFRDALNAVGKAIGDALPFLRPLLDGLTGLGKMLGLVPQEAEAASDGMGDLEGSESDLTGTTTDLTGANNTLSMSMRDLQLAADQNTGTIEEMNKARADAVNEAMNFIHAATNTAVALQLNSREAIAFASVLQDQDKQVDQSAVTLTRLAISALGTDEALRAIAHYGLAETVDMLDEATLASKGWISVNGEWVNVADQQEQALADLGLAYQEDAMMAQAYADALNLNIDVSNESIHTQALMARSMQLFSQNTSGATDSLIVEAGAIALVKGDMEAYNAIMHGNVVLARETIAANKDIADSLQEESTIVDEITNKWQEGSDALGALLEQHGLEANAIQGGIRARSILNDAINQAVEIRTTEVDAVKAEAAAIAILNEDYKMAEALINGNVAAAQAYIDANEETAASLEQAKSVLGQWRSELTEGVKSAQDMAKAFGHDISNTLLKTTQDWLAYGEAQEMVRQLTFDTEVAIKGEAMALAGLHPELMTMQELMSMQIGEQNGFVISTNKLIDASKEAGTAFFNLSQQEQRRLETLGVTADAAGRAAAGLEILTQAEINHINSATEAAELQEEHNKTMSEFSPIIQEGARAWGIFDDAQAANTATGRAQMQGLEDLQGMYDDMIGSAREIAVSQLGMQQAYQMTDNELIGFIATAGDLNEAQLSIAETAQQAGLEFQEAWMASFEAIKASQQEFGNNMGSAMQKMAEHFGEEMEVGLSGVEKTIAKGLQGFTQQFTEEIFPEDFLATAIIKGNSPQDIANELEKLWDDVVDAGIITEDEAKTVFQPFLDFIETGLPEDSEQAMGYLIGRMPHIMDQITPVIVNGVQVAGGEARQALKTDLVDPFIAEMQALEGGASGLDVGRGLLTSVQNMMPQLEQEFPKIAGLMQQTLDNTALTADEKVQEIIGYLGQINPEWEAMIMEMDKDGDGIKDIVDDKVLNPMEMMRLQALETGAAIALAFGNEEAYNILQGKINELMGTTTDMRESVVDDWEKVSQITGTSVSTMNDNLDMLKNQGWTEVAGASKDASQKIVQSADGSKRAVFDFKNNTITYLGEAETKYNTTAGVLGTPATMAAPDTAAAIAAMDAVMQKAREVQQMEDDAWFAKQDAAAGDGATSTPIGQQQSTAPPPPDFSAHTQAWNDYTTHIQNSVNSIYNHLTTSANHYMNYGRGTGLVLQRIGDIWVAFAEGLAAYAEGDHLAAMTALADQYMNFLRGSGLVIEQVSEIWIAFAEGLQAYADGPHLDAMTAIADQYMNFSAGVFEILDDRVKGAWDSYHGYLEAFGSAHLAAMTVMAGHYMNFMQGSGRVLSIIAGYWDDFTTWMGRLARSQHLRALTIMADQYVNLRDGVRIVMQQLSTAVQNGISRIVAQMQRGAQGARQLQQALNALRSREITITTRYRTIGSPAGGARRAQHGMNEVVTQPRFILVAEKEPELVTVQPLASTQSKGLGDAGFFGAGGRGAGAANVNAGTLVRNIAATTGGQTDMSGGGGSNRPVVVNVHVTIPLDEQILGESAAKTVLTNIGSYR